MSSPVRPEGVLSYEEWKRRRALESAPDREPEDERRGVLGGLGGQLAQGATLGVLNPIMAGAGTIVRKVQGDDRPVREIYGQLAQNVKDEEAAYRADNPVVSLAANVGGALASPASGALNTLRVARGLGPAARATNAATQGAVAGGVAGAANTTGDESVWENTALGAGLGGALGGAFSGLTDAGKQVGRMIGAGPGATGVRGAIQRRVGGEAVEESGVRRMGDLLRREGVDLATLQQRSAAAPSEDILAEQLGARGVRALRTARGLGDKAPSTIDDALTDRALNEASKLRQTFAQLSGASRADAKTVADEALAKVKPVVDELYASAAPVPLAGESKRVLDVVQQLDNDGFGVWKLARKLGGLPESIGRPAVRTPALDAIEEAAEGARTAWQQAQEAAAEYEGWGKLIADVDAVSVRTRSPNLTPAMRRKNTMANRRATDEVLSRGEQREVGKDLTEDAIGLIEDAGFDVASYRDLVKRGTEALRRLPSLKSRAEQADEALRKAIAASGGEAPPELTVGQALKVRQALDAMIDDSAEKSADRIVMARLAEARAQVDQVVKRAGGNNAAATAVQEADALFTDAKRIGESFGAGVRAAQSGDAQIASRMLREASKPEQARAGVGSEILRRLGGVVDEGGIQNPGPRVTGGEERRQLARMAFPDESAFNTFRQATDDSGRRLSTMRTVMGGSQTADKLADFADFATDPSVYTNVATGNLFGVGQKLATSGIARRLGATNAQEADELAKYLLAGAPGQMTREEAIAQLVKLLPAVQRRQGAQATRRAVLGATAGQQLNR